MEKLTYEEWAQRELKRWNETFAEGKELPSIVTRVLETAYKRYVSYSEEDEKQREESLKQLGLL